MELSVVGCGYLGAVHAACMADLGHTVVGIDVDVTRITKLAAGEPPFHEPGFGEVLARGLESGRLRFTTDVAAVAPARVHFIAVGTPQRSGSYAADLRYVDAAIAAIGPHLRRSEDGPAVVAGKSTVPVGTAARLAATLGTRATLVWNPEFLREGFAVQDTLAPDRIVYGLPPAPEAAEAAREALNAVYAPILAKGTPLIEADYATAELVKVAANSFLATKISFINAMADLCEVTGADVTLLAEAIGHDDRIGRKFLRAGVGFGGGCLPKDIRAFMARAGELGAEQSLTFLREIDSINLRRRQHVVNLAIHALEGRVPGKRVTVLGAAFKPHSDDLRDSPAVDVASRLAGLGARVRITDPAATGPLRAVRPDLDVVDHVEEAVTGADVVLLLTEWPEYVSLDPHRIGDLVASRQIIDGRNVLDLVAWRGAGWTCTSLGRP